MILSAMRSRSSTDCFKSRRRIVNASNSSRRSTCRVVKDFCTTSRNNVRIFSASPGSLRDRLSFSAMLWLSRSRSSRARCVIIRFRFVESVRGMSELRSGRSIDATNFSASRTSVGSPKMSTELFGWSATTSMKCFNGLPTESYRIENHRNCLSV